MQLQERVLRRPSLAMQPGRRRGGGGGSRRPWTLLELKSAHDVLSVARLSPTHVRCVVLPVGELSDAVWLMQQCAPAPSS